MAAPAAAPDPAFRDPSSPAATTPTIVVADDEADLLKAMVVSLTAKGFTVIPAASGEEAIRQITTHHPDLAIIDVMMPRMSGFQVARVIKFDKRLKTIPVILLTARTEESHRRMGYQVGADEYIAKPCESAHLLERIRYWLAKSAERAPQPPRPASSSTGMERGETPQRSSPKEQDRRRVPRAGHRFLVRYAHSPQDAH